MVFAELTKEYLEIEIIVPEVITDQVSNFLIELGSSDLWSKPNGDNLALIGYLSFQSDTESVKNSTHHNLDELRKLGFPVGENGVVLRKIKDKNWIEESKSNFEPIFVTDDIVIIPNWDGSSFPEKIVIRIKPGMAFGTGAHATTQLCMRALKRYVKPGDKIVDVGCGSGILSILSSKLGASFVRGWDIDQDAIENSSENLTLNQVESLVEIKQGTVSANIPEIPFDLAVANLNKREIFESFEKIKIQIKDEGVLIFSGILKEEENEVKDFFQKKSLKIIVIIRQDDWVCFVCKK